MVRCKSTPRFSSINSVVAAKAAHPNPSGCVALASPVILTQTDTTVGFISQDHQKLAEIKSRPSQKPFIKILHSFTGLRVPKKYKSKLRRSTKTTFIINNQAFRIAPHTQNSQLMRDMPWHYSTSANASNKNFDREYCVQNADIIIEDVHGLQEFSASRLIKLTNHKQRKLR